MYPHVDWTNDVVPQIAAFLSSGVVAGAIIATAAIAVAALGARAILGIFFHH